MPVFALIRRPSLVHTRRISPNNDRPCQFIFSRLSDVAGLRSTWKLHEISRANGVSARNAIDISSTREHSVPSSRRFKIAGPSWPRDNYGYVQPNESESEYYQRRACLYPEVQRNYGASNWADQGGNQWVSSYYEGQTFYGQQKRSEGKFDMICTSFAQFYSSLTRVLTVSNKICDSWTVLLKFWWLQSTFFAELVKAIICTNPSCIFKNFFRQLTRRSRFSLKEVLNTRAVR